MKHAAQKLAERRTDRAIVRASKPRKPSAAALLRAYNLAKSGK